MIRDIKARILKLQRLKRDLWKAKKQRLIYENATDINGMKAFIKANEKVQYAWLKYQRLKFPWMKTLDM